MHQLAPASRIIGMLASPVKAPLGSQWQFCAPTLAGVLSNSKTEFTALIFTIAGQMTTST